MSYYSRVKREPPVNSTIREDDDKKKPFKQKIRAHLKDTCFFCGRNMSSAAQTLQHNIRMHGYKLPKRIQGYKRPESREFEYVREKNAKCDVEELACPSCWFHCPENDLEALYQHTRKEHETIKVEGTKGQKNGDEKEVEPASASVRAHRSLTPNYDYFSGNYYQKPKSKNYKKNERLDEEAYERKSYHDSKHDGSQIGKKYDYDDEKGYYSGVS